MATTYSPVEWRFLGPVVRVHQEPLLVLALFYDVTENVYVAARSCEMQQGVLALVHVCLFYLGALLVVSVIEVIVIYRCLLASLIHGGCLISVQLAPLWNELTFPEAVLAIATVELLNLLGKHILNEVKNLRGSC